MKKRPFRLSCSGCRLLLFAVALGVTVLSYWGLLCSSCGHAWRWDWYSSYHLLVPLLSLCFLIRDRRAIRASVGAPSAFGLLLLVPCLVFGWLGEQGMQIRFEIVGCLGTLLGLVWAFFGVRTMQAVLFPVGYLIFFLCFSVWLEAGDKLTQAMKVATSELFASVMEGEGFVVCRQGARMSVPALRLTVDLSHNFGTFALNSVLVMAGAISYFIQPTNLRRFLLVALNVPFVVVGNALFAWTSGLQAIVLTLAFCGILTAVASRLITKGAKRCARS